MDNKLELSIAVIVVVAIAAALFMFFPVGGYLNIRNPLATNVSADTDGTPAKPTMQGQTPVPAQGQVVSTGYEQLYSFEVRQFPAEVIREVPDMRRIQFDVIASVPVGFEIWRGSQLIGGALNARMEHYGYLLDVYKGEGGNFTFRLSSDREGSALVVVASKADLS